MFIQSIPLADKTEIATASEMQVKTYGHTKLSSEIRRSIELTSDDITQLCAPTTSLPEGWDVKVVRTGVTQYRANAAYFFRAGSGLDAAPSVVVMRSADAYMVITHDVVAWLQEPTTDVLICSELSEAIAAVHVLICEAAEADDDAR